MQKYLFWCNSTIVHFQEAIFRVVAAILHIGNIDFAKGEEIDSSVIKDEKSRFHLNMTAELLMYVNFMPLYPTLDHPLISFLGSPFIIFLWSTVAGVMPRV